MEMSKFGDYEKGDIKLYQYLIGKFIYLLFGTRSNISFTVGQLNKYNSDPGIGYIKAAKKVVRYLKGIMHIKLVYRSLS